MAQKPTEETGDDFQLNLGNLNSGVTLELFQDLQKQVLENIRDVNTIATQTREITIKFKFKPSVDRKSAQVHVVPSLKLAQQQPTVGTIYVTKVHGEVKGYIHDPAQDELRFAETSGKQ